MNKQLRRLGAGLLACYLALFVMVNYVQVVAAGDLNDKPENTRAIVRDFSQPRGQIVTADGAVLAASVPSNDQFELQRQYPEGDLFGHITGYFSFNFGATGLEKTYNDELAGQTTEQQLRTLSDLFVEREHTGDVTISMRKDVQETARAALGEQRGSVVALDPRNGELLAMWSFPSFDPNELSGHDFGHAADVKAFLEAAPERPLRARTYQERFFPGSTFKVVTAATGVETRLVTPTEPSYPTLTTLDLPQTTRNLANFGGSACGGPLPEILRVSCNTAFAQMGLDLGPDRMRAGAASFGFNERPPIDLPASAASAFPELDSQNLPVLAQAAIGQNSVQASPLQMALVAGAIANNGLIMTPHLMREIRDDQGEVVETYEPEAWRQAVSAPAAATVRDAMRGVVTNGTARGLAIAGFDVGGKTGTAQINPEDPNRGVLAWVIGFAGPPGQPASVAIAVLVEDQVGFSEATGGRVAAPIAQAVLSKILEAQAAG